MNRYNSWIIDNRTGLVISAILCLLYILPILLAGHIYIDDHTRTTRFFLWSQDARYVANFIFNALSLGNGQLDYFPVTNILGALLVGLSGILACIIFNITGSFNVVLMVSAMISSPFLVANLTYRFDSLTMGLSVLTAVFPYLFINNRKIFCLLSIVSLIVTGMLYQSSMALFLSIGLAYHAVNYSNIRSYFNSVFLMCLLFLASSIIIIIVSRFVGGIDRTDLFISSESPISTISYNINGMLSLLKSSAHGVVFASYALAILCFVVGCVLSLKKGIEYAVIQVLSFVFILISTVILNIILLSPWFNSRIMIAFPVLILFCFVVFIKNTKNDNLATPFVATGIFSCAILFISVFANSLSAQDRLNNVYLSRILSLTNSDTTKIAMYGKQPLSREFIRSASIYPLLENLIPNYMIQGSGWAQAYIGMMTSKFQMISMKEQEDVLSKSCSVDTWGINHMFHYKYYKEYLIISFKGDNC